MSDPYIPIPCGDYSRYEEYILYRRKLRVWWRDGKGETRMDTLRPLDLFTRDGKEFLVAESMENGRMELRLDRILETRPLISGPGSAGETGNPP
jgi:transcriptional antiterminator Rof (Rho-off)